MEQQLRLPRGVPGDGLNPTQKEDGEGEEVCLQEPTQPRNPQRRNFRSRASSMRHARSSGKRSPSLSDSSNGGGREASLPESSSWSCGLAAFFCTRSECLTAAKFGANG